MPRLRRRRVSSTSLKPLPFFLPWLRVNLLIRTITGRVWDERAWPLAKAHLGRAFEIRRDLARAPVELTPPRLTCPRARPTVPAWIADAS